MIFNEDFYEKVIREYKYDPMDFGPMDFWFGNISPQVMDSKWLCHSGINKIDDFDNTIFTSGIGLSGTPHMGTLSQILRLIFLQKQGFKAQMVLGDLDSYNARNQDFDIVRRRAYKYYDFIINMGFDENKGILRSQYGSANIAETAFLVSKYVRDQDFLDTEEDLSELYIKEKIYEGINFPVKQAILLMISDFINLGLNDKYKNVVVMLGLEEHQYVLLARKAIQRMNLSFDINGMYSKIIKGLNGYPKMSKSISLSSIRVDMKADEIRSKIISEEDNYKLPEDSVIYQLMSNVSNYSLDELKKLHDICKEKGNQWIDAKIDYSDKLVNICKLWK